MNATQRSSREACLLLLFLFFISGCDDLRGARGFGSALDSTAYPAATHPKQVGRYPAQVDPGDGIFYDEVLEYRVWSKRVTGESVYRSFATYEEAKAQARRASGSEEPTVLVRQLEYVDEPRPGRYTAVEEERMVEWDPKKLADHLRGPTSIADFLKEQDQ